MALASSPGSRVQGCLWGGRWEIDRRGQLDIGGWERRTEDFIAVSGEVSLPEGGAPRKGKGLLEVEEGHGSLLELCTKEWLVNIAASGQNTRGL